VDLLAAVDYAKSPLVRLGVLMRLDKDAYARGVQELHGSQIHDHDLAFMFARVAYLRRKRGGGIQIELAAWNKHDRIILPAHL
jgi:hypothetical protein